MLAYAGIVHGVFLNVPYYMVLGNHDDRYYENVVIRDAAKDEFARVFGLKESKTQYPISPIRFPGNYYSIEKNGFTLIMLDSTAEHPPHGHSDPGYNDGIHFGSDQFVWMEYELSNCEDGRAILFWHRNPGAEIKDVPAPSDKSFDAQKYDYLKALYPFKNKIAMIFVGHGHKYDRYEWQGIKFYEVTTTVCGIYPRYYHVLCDPTNGSVVILNKDTIFDNPEHDVSCKPY